MITVKDGAFIKVAASKYFYVYGNLEVLKK